MTTSTTTVTLSTEDWERIKRALAYTADTLHDTNPLKADKYDETLEQLEEELRVQ